MDIQTDMTGFYEHKIQNEEGEMIIEWKMENGKWKNKQNQDQVDVGC